MNEEQYLDITMGHLTLDDPETGEPLIDEETGEVQYETTGVPHEDKPCGGTKEECDVDPETGERLTHAEPSVVKPAFKTTFKIPAAYLGSRALEAFTSKGPAKTTESEKTHEVVVTKDKGCLLLGKKRRRSGDENECGLKATFVHKKVASQDIRGKFGNNFLEGQAWPKLLIGLGLFILMPGFAIPFFLMARLYTHYKSHHRLNPTVSLDDDEILPCGLKRKEVGKYMVLHTLLHMCRICREEYAGEKFARAHSDLHSSTPQNRNTHSTTLNLGGADRITCCG